jgi:hypothetical protein
MEKTKAKKRSDKETLSEITKEMAKPRVAASARSGESSSPFDPTEVLGKSKGEIGCALAGEHGDVADAQPEYLSKTRRAQSVDNLAAQLRHSVATLSDVKRVARRRGMRTLTELHSEIRVISSSDLPLGGQKD